MLIILKEDSKGAVLDLNKAYKISTTMDSNEYYKKRSFKKVNKP
jgi:hypothetical protein